MNCTIIIPAIKINKLLNHVLKFCLNINKVEILVVYNKLSNNFLKDKRIAYIRTNKVNMSEKRNIAVDKSKKEYIAFLDSDSYPDINWLDNGISILKKQNDVGIVTGPEISFPEQTYLENAVGISNQSFLITGSHCFRKSILSDSRFYSEASACNIIMRRKDYNVINGMNSEIYLGEDKEFSHRVRSILKKKIFFSKSVRVFHKDRNFTGFLLQRYARGVASSDLTLRLRNFFRYISLKNFLNQRFELFLPFLFIIFSLTWPVTLVLEFWKYFYFSVLSLYLVVILFETYRKTRRKLNYFFLVYFLLIVGTIIPGFAQLMELLRIKIDTRKFYRNFNDI